MESNGRRNKIHISGETADLLIEADKENWITPREDVIVAKGKGALQTYWLALSKHESSHSPSAYQGSVNDTADTVAALDNTEVDIRARKASNSAAAMKVQRLIDWNSDLLLQLLMKIVARRTSLTTGAPKTNGEIKKLELVVGEGGTPPLEEIQEIITLPKFDATAAKDEIDPKTVDLGEHVPTQLRDFVAVLASLYRDNPFHCFEHASHVTMSVSKLLSRIAAPDLLETQGDDDLASALHDHTYGITSDPLTQFSVVMAAMIHDVDHRGVPNSILCKEDPQLASVYHGKSVAEQNSIDVAWNAMMDPSFEDLRKCIYGDENEFQRFRSLLVNSVMATDIFDKELALLRKSRWNKAFQEGQREGSAMDDVNRKATIVIEHLIQASDVSHTMQHWHVYQKWNARLFEETYSAFLTGRSDTDPSEGWYKGEIGFFDHYIIPLARKLKECGVFGVSSDEYLSYATENRREWEAKGIAVVTALVQKCHAKHLQSEETSGFPCKSPIV